MIELNKKNYLVLIVIGMILLAIRNPVPLIHPSIYAEDGVWVANALSHGWINAFIHARDDYFVFFNIFFLFVSTTISNIVSGNPLLFLPQSIALVSYLFYTVVSTMAYAAVLRISNVGYAILAFLLILYVPLGLSQNETIGHLLQIGFYMPMMALCLILYRENIDSKFHKTFIDLLIFLAAATNPVVFPIVGLFYLAKFAVSKDKIKLVKDLFPLALSMFVLALIILPRLNGSGGVDNHAYNPHNIVELVSARLLLYPFVFPWYEKLNDLISVCLSIVYFAFCLFVIFKTEDRNARKFLLAMLMTLVINIAATVVGRVGLTDFLNHYTGTFPDRYFVGSNILALLLFVACLSQCTFSRLSHRVAAVIGVCLLVVYIWNISSILERKEFVKRTAVNEYFSRELCKAQKIPGESSVIQIKPKGWQMTVPANLVADIVCR
ncbi:hypothetical protein [Lelliottia sp.]|uniref:hypothetical protein n=1 Tax=Lelliottia sp. TaxID=1898429 RepID=UPI00388EDCB0